MDPGWPAVDPVDVSRRAYEIYLSRGAAPGMALDDWLQAERELIEGSLMSGDETSLSPSLQDDWELVRVASVNLLLVGPDNVTRALVDALGPFLRKPVITVRPGEPLTLAPTGQVGTLTLYDVSMLGLSDQRRLLDWQESAVGRTQVISTTSTPLLPLVDAGAFLGALYYRLNTVCLEVTASHRKRFRASREEPSVLATEHGGRPHPGR